MESAFAKVSTPIRVGLLGAGVIAAPHAAALKTLAGTADLVAVCDTDSAKAAAFSQAWNIPQVFTDLGSMLAQAKPDVVHVLLPPAAHAAPAIQCIERGSHVFIEKPFCLTSQECRSVIAAAEANHRRVGVNHNLTFMPSFLRVIDEIRAWRLGAIQHVTVMYALPIGVIKTGPHGHWMFGSPERIILELGPHPLSIVHRLLGPVKSAAALASDRRILSNGQPFYETWQASLACERGTAQCVLAMGGEFLSTWIHVIGQDGEARADLRRNTVQFSEKIPFPRTDVLRDALRNGAALRKQGWKNHIARMKGMLGFTPPYEMQTFSMNSSVAAFYDALRTGRPLPVDAADGSAVVECCESIISSALMEQHARV